MSKPINKMRGFTLVEIMIVIAIIGVVTGFAVTNYQASAIKTKRGEAKSQLSQIVQEIERNRLVYNNSYRRIPVDAIGFDVSGQKDIGYYNVVINSEIRSGTVFIANNAWELVANPKTTSVMKDDGVIKINREGQKCWDGDGDCTLSATSSWD